MKNYTKDELQELVTSISQDVSTFDINIASTGNKNEDALETLVSCISQVQNNCEKIIVETLNHILND